VETQFDSTIQAGLAYRSYRVRAISALGPLTVFGACVWAVLQPYRLTLLHPHHQGFWWLAVEPPLLVVFAGIVFAVFVARALVEDLEDDGTA